MNFSLLDQVRLSKIKTHNYFHPPVDQYHSLIRTEQQQQYQSPGQEAAWHIF